MHGILGEREGAKTCLASSLKGRQASCPQICSVSVEKCSFSSARLSRAVALISTSPGVSRVCVVSRYLQNGSSVLGCFLDASKAFDMVDHCKLLYILNKRGLPMPIIRFLLSWYQKQEMKVQWGSSLSNGFSVSNGVWQGGVLSPYFLQCILMEELSNSCVGCYWGSAFVGALA